MDEFRLVIEDSDEATIPFWPTSAVVYINGHRLYDRPAVRYAGLGPFRFDRREYEAALQSAADAFGAARWRRLTRFGATSSSVRQRPVRAVGAVDGHCRAPVFR